MKQVQLDKVKTHATKTQYMIVDPLGITQKLLWTEISLHDL